MPRVVKSTVYLYNSESSVLPFMQGDTTLLILRLFEKHNKPFSPTDVALIIERADKSIRIQNININIQNNTLKILLIPEMVDIAGAIKLQFKFTDSNGIISSYIINGIVDPDIIDNQTAVTASKLNDALRIFGRPPYIDINTKTWWIYDLEEQDFVDTGVSVGDAVVDSLFDINSDRAIANKTVTAKFNETDSNIASLELKTGNNSDDIGDINNKITDINTNVNTISNRVTTTESDIAELDYEVSNIGNNIIQLRTDIDSNTTSINDIANDIQSINDKIVNIESDTADIHGELDTLDDRVGDSENSITALRADADNIALDINGINDEITNIVNDISDVKTDITDLRTDVDNNTSAIGEIETNINDIGDDVSALDDRITAAKSEIYRNTTNALITTTEMADMLTIQPNPNDTSFHGLMISLPIGGVGNTPPVVAPTITVSGKNIIPGNFAEWESGEYSASTGAKATSANRVRLKELLPVSPLGAYFFTTNHNTLTFIARGYDQNKDFVQDISIITNGTVKTIANNVHFIGLMIYASSGTAPVFGDYQQLFANGNIKPFVCFNSIPDKSYEPYVGLQSVTLGGITLDDGDHIEMDNGVVTSTIGGVSTDITATTNGQALLGLHGYDVDTVIQMSGGAMVGVKYNRDIAALGGRVASLGRKSMSAAIATTETADTLTIDTMSPDDKSFHGLTIYGNTPSVVAPTITVSGKNLFNAASDKIYNGTQQYSPTTAAPVIKQYDIIYGMTGNGYIDCRNIVDVSYTNDFVALRAMSRGYGLAVKVKGFIPGNTYTKTYTAGAGVVLHWVCWDVDGSYIALQNNTVKTFVVPQNTAHLFLLFGWGTAAGDAVNYTKIQIESGAINSVHEPYAGLQSVTLTGVELFESDTIVMKNGKVTSTIGGVSTDITATANGQALLGLHGYDVDTVIQMSGGASGNIRYNLSGQTIYDMLIALLGG